MTNSRNTTLSLVTVIGVVFLTGMATRAIEEFIVRWVNLTDVAGGGLVSPADIVSGDTRSITTAMLKLIIPGVLIQAVLIKGLLQSLTTVRVPLIADSVDTVSVRGRSDRIAAGDRSRVRQGSGPRRAHDLHPVDALLLGRDDRRYLDLRRRIDPRSVPAPRGSLPRRHLRSIAPETQSTPRSTGISRRLPARLLRAGTAADRRLRPARRAPRQTGDPPTPRRQSCRGSRHHRSPVSVGAPGSSARDRELESQRLIGEPRGDVEIRVSRQAPALARYRRTLL